ncbi:helix-turn-helix transcriptional regulator [Antarcticirhabdus aurantiaca]|uniref:LuxR C-terminal-related transcriptional regulator n=1 Tax=Antarcticirhabdus aurantiaca TaxID=2606717 RepID=A0ACD4NPA7_9HYPH|nr:LuxR family transcriptional regulator [Antarcticirhabdus aurantiaca]WAJ28535.1 LuxR C-terminal-related transcriptional regulator [Jeongeuplla avenae]
MERRTERDGGAGDRAGWQNGVGAIIAHLGRPELPDILDAALRGLASFDLSVIFAYPEGARPLHLHDGLGLHRPGAALDAYLDGAFLLDPFYVACAKPVAPGLYRMSDLAPDAFFEGHYVNNWEVHPCISMESGSLAEEIGYVVPLPGGPMAVYSLMRSAGSAPFDAAEFERLASVEPVVREAIRAQWRDLAVPAMRVEAAGEAGEDGAELVLDRAFAGFCPGLLSTRERVVTQMVLRGHSTHSVAALLGIAEGTVKNHRKSIYAKLGIASQQELFSLFLAHILARRDGPDAASRAA